MTQIKKGDLSYLGKKVSCVVDRKIGSVHPKHPDIIYPLNYGYVEGLIAGDGEEQDVYFLSEKNSPVKSFEGVVIGIIERIDDNEDKWVAVSEKDLGTPLCYECNVMHEVNFQEQFYHSKFHPLYEKTAGAIMFTRQNGRLEILLTESFKGHIGFPKGHIEYGETEEQTALREVLEETGLKASLLDGFRAEYTFKTLENSTKTSVFFASEFTGKPVLQQEEVKNHWLVPLDEAMEKLNWESDRDILRSFRDFLQNN